MYFPKVTLLYYIKISVCLSPDQGGSKQIFTSTQGRCSLHWFRGEAALHDPQVLRVACVPSSPQISYLTTITTIHSRTKNTQKNAQPVPQISRAEASGWCDTTIGGLDLIQSGPFHICLWLQRALYSVKSQLFRDLLCWWKGSLITAALCV